MSKVYLNRPKPKNAIYLRSIALSLQLGLLICIPIYALGGHRLPWAFPLEAPGVGIGILLNTKEIITLAVSRFNRSPNWMLILGDFLVVAMFSYPDYNGAAFLLLSRTSPAEEDYSQGNANGWAESDEGRQEIAVEEMLYRLEEARTVVMLMATLLHLYFFVRVSVDSRRQRRARKREASAKDPEDVMLEEIQTKS